MRKTTRDLIAPAAWSQADPTWWCTACADDDHANHVVVYLDPFGEDSACCCPSCE